MDTIGYTLADKLRFEFINPYFDDTDQIPVTGFGGLVYKGNRLFVVSKYILKEYINGAFTDVFDFKTNFSDFNTSARVISIIGDYVVMYYQDISSFKIWKYNISDGTSSSNETTFGTAQLRFTHDNDRNLYFVVFSNFREVIHKYDIINNTFTELPVFVGNYARNGVPFYHNNKIYLYQNNIADIYIVDLSNNTTSNDYSSKNPPLDMQYSQFFYVKDRFFTYNKSALFEFINNEWYTHYFPYNFSGALGHFVLNNKLYLSEYSPCKRLMLPQYNVYGLSSLKSYLIAN
ncbi:hypothetical protein [Clostridium lundense]|uniref:hypothetical protein n=1 Tax=Clostridium lundense TaxID=319475 RepID=UPI00048718DB|nr:hypothetical protein [Clostridium lundense]